MIRLQSVQQRRVTFDAIRRRMISAFRECFVMMASTIAHRHIAAMNQNCRNKKTISNNTTPIRIRTKTRIITNMCTTDIVRLLKRNLPAVSPSVTSNTASSTSLLSLPSHCAFNHFFQFTCNHLNVIQPHL